MSEEFDLLTNSCEKFTLRILIKELSGCKLFNINYVGRVCSMQVMDDIIILRINSN